MAAKKAAEAAKAEAEAAAKKANESAGFDVDFSMPKGLADPVFAVNLTSLLNEEQQATAKLAQEEASSRQVAAMKRQARLDARRKNKRK